MKHSNIIKAKTIHMIMKDTAFEVILIENTSSQSKSIFHCKYFILMLLGLNDP